MLKGIDPLLTGEVLDHLDQMGHSDIVCLADAHFPARRIGARVVDMPGVGVAEMVAAVCSVIPLDEAPAVDLMDRAEAGLNEVQHRVLEAADVDPAAVRLLERQRFYQVAQEAFLVIRTGERATFGNAMLRKGVVTVAPEAKP